MLGKIFKCECFKLNLLLQKILVEEHRFCSKANNADLPVI